MNTARFPLLVRAVMREIFALALETPKEVADVFVEFSAHVDRIHIRAYVGGWRRNEAADFDLCPDFNFEDSRRVVEEAEKALAALTAFLADAPRIVAERQAREKAEFARECAEMTAAVAAHHDAKRARADEATLHTLAVKVLSLMESMGGTEPSWWDDKNGTWGLGVLDSDEIEALDRGAVIAGPHSS